MHHNFFKFDERIEAVYLTQFSGWRYKIFQFLEKLYKKLIDSKNGRIEFIIDYISKTKPIFILEVGSGVFPMYSFLSPVLQRKCEYHICEVNLEKVKYLQRKYPNLKIICANALSLPYEDNYFDFVFSKGVFHHVDDNDPKKRKQKKLDFLRESKRVLKKGGVNLLMDFYYNPRQFKDVLWHKLYRIILWESDYNYSSQEGVEKFFKITGYKNIQSTQFDTFKGLYYCVIGEK
jgi:ubiquinone/menaquinone biosynthesis C-methylase UbiE